MRLLVVLVGVGLVSCSPASGPKERPPPLVTTAIVPAEDVPLLVRAPVDVRPLAQVDIGAKAVGVLDSVLVDRGDVVKKGQLLALVRPSDLPDQLLAAKNALAQAVASKRLAQSNLERAQALAPRGLVSQQELQSATAAAAAAEAQGGAAEAQLAVLAVRLGETRLDAPFDGVVLARRLDPGAVVGPTSGAVVTVGRVDTVRVFVAVPERKASLLEVGQRASIHLDALDGQGVEGRVERLAPAYDSTTRTLDAEVHFANASGRLRPGMYGRAQVQVGLHEKRPVVPVEAVQISDGRAFVFVVTADAVARRRIDLGEDLGSRLEIRAGLEPGEEIVVRGIDMLSNGSRIRRSGGADGGLAGPARL
jgi:membrane fusion protein, multidrug efflux system